MIDINELRPAVEAAGLNAISMLEVLELLGRLEDAESDALEQARLNGMGSEREAALMAKLEAAEKCAQLAPSFADAYQGAMEEVAIWKRRALEAEDLNRKFVAEINGPAYMGEPAQPAPSINPAALSPVINWLRNGCDPMKAADELELLAAAPVYLAPGAQPAPSVPEGWKLVPIEPTEKMISEGSCASSLPGPHYISEHCAKQCWGYMLAAPPEVKP